jgi:hypothetical protein
MSDFKRRPFMAGHTDVFILAQPYISGTEHINSDAQLDSIETVIADALAALAAPPIIELSFETESGDGDFQLDLNTAAPEDRTLAAIVAEINNQFGTGSPSPLIEAVDYEGTLRLQTLSSGYDAINGNAYIRILPKQSGALIEDAAPLFGFPRHPHPEATVTAGDLAAAPVRPLTQINRPGVAFLARGEDRVSQNFNRGLHQLAINADSLNTRLKESVPVPTVLDIPKTSLRLIKDVDNSIVALDLSSGYADDIDGVITDTSAVFVGQLDNNSSLAEIAQFFSVQDQDDNQIQADERVVRVGAVINGFLGGASSVPSFLSETSPPTAPVPDSLTYIADYGNILGVAVPKTAAVGITVIRDGSVLECESATFVSDNVLKGDIATIAGSAINAPINHDGDYYVERVISETEIEVRPIDFENVALLNESDSAGLGSVSISTDGKFARAQKCVLLFSPPIADFPPDRVADDGLTTIEGILRIVLGVEAPLGEVPTSFLTQSTILTAAEVDAFVTRRIWRRLSFDGVYQGQSYDYRGTQRGGGAEGRITHGPISFNMVSQQERVVGPTLTNGSGDLEMRGTDLVLTTDSTVVLSDTDIGKVIYLTDGGLPPELFAPATPFVISEFLSYREVRLTPPVDYKEWRDSDFPAGTTRACSFDIADDGQAAMQAAMMFVAGDLTFDEVKSSKTGMVFVRNHRDLGNDEASPGTSVLHVERIRTVRADGTGSTDVSARFLTALTTAGTSTVSLEDGSGNVVHPEFNPHMFYSKGSTVRTTGGVGCTLLRIVNGENAGFYEIFDHNTATGEFEIRPVEHAFDESTVVWSGFEAASVDQVANLYTVVFSAGGKRNVDDPIDGSTNVISGVTAFADAVDKYAYGPGVPAVARAIQAHWIGPGAGLVVRVNDPEFVSLNLDNAGTGDSINIAAWAPADGIRVQTVAPGIGTADQGRIYGLSVSAKGYGTDADKATPAEDGVDMVADRSFSAAITQHGRDAGLVVSKYENSTIDLSGLSGSSLFSGASLVVARGMVGVEKAPSGMGSAIEVLGSMWVHTSSAEDQPYGGVFSEDVMGAGKWLYPIWGYDPTKHFLTPYVDDNTPPGSLTYSWDAPANLGNPGIMIPHVTSGVLDPDPDGTFDLPDHQLFNFHHDGILTVSDIAAAGLAEPLSKYIGCIAESTYPPVSAIKGELFSIVGVVRSGVGGTDATFALRGSVPVAAQVVGWFRIRGLRWEQAHIDIAEYFHVGTHMVASPLNIMPLVTSDRLSLYFRTVRDLPISGPQGYAKFRNISRSSWSPGAAGIGIGGSGPFETFVDNTYADRDNGGWTGTYDAPKHTHIWQGQKDEARPPFFSSIALPLEKGANPIGHVARDFVYYGLGSVQYDDAWGGALNISVPSGPNDLHLVNRGRRYQLTDHTWIRVWVRVAARNVSYPVPPDPGAITFSLRDSVTDLDLVSETVGFDELTLDTLNTHFVDLKIDKTRFKGDGELAMARLDAELLLHVTFHNPDIGVGPSRNYYVQELKAESLTQPLVVDAPMIVNGPIYAEGYRYTNPIRGYATISPLKVELFGGAHYARNFSWPYDATALSGVGGVAWAYGGRLELYGGPGLLRTKNEQRIYEDFVLSTVISNDPADFGLTDQEAQIDALHVALNTAWPPSGQDIWGFVEDETLRFNVIYNGTENYPGPSASWAPSADAYGEMISIATYIRG